MKRLFLLLFVVIAASKISFSQEVKKPVHYKYLFDPNIDAEKELKETIARAKNAHKRVLIIVGGDWNYWSELLYNDLQNSKYLKLYYELDLINFSPLNKNVATLSALSCPKDVGYPVLIVLDENGNRLTATDTDRMKADKKKYDTYQLDRFLTNWGSSNQKS